MDLNGREEGEKGKRRRRRVGGGGAFALAATIADVAAAVVAAAANSARLNICTVQKPQNPSIGVSQLHTIE